MFEKERLLLEREQLLDQLESLKFNNEMCNREYVRETKQLEMHIKEIEHELTLF
jgi:hypothetical protein